MNRRTMTLLINFSKFVHLLICAQNGSRKPILQNNAFLLMRHCVLSRDGLVLKCIIDYCSKMGGVDLMDELTQYHEISRRSLKWSRKFIFYLIDICLVNAYCLHSKFASLLINFHNMTFANQLLKPLSQMHPMQRNLQREGEDVLPQLQMKLLCVLLKGISVLTFLLHLTLNANMLQETVSVVTCHHQQELGVGEFRQVTGVRFARHLYATQTVSNYFTLTLITSKRPGAGGYGLQN